MPVLWKTVVRSGKNEYLTDNLVNSQLSGLVIKLLTYPEENTSLWIEMIISVLDII